MSLAITTAARPSKARELQEFNSRAVRRVRIGLLGLGRVNQAVVRLAAEEAPRLLDAGLRLHFVQALVREPFKQRALSGDLLPPRTGDAEAFLAGEYDVVVEALGGVEPAAGLLTKLLRRGVPVISANKAVLAARGAQLHAAARKGGAWLRDDAAAIAGVPFLDSLRARPLLGRARRVTAVLNGTSNFIASTIARGAAEFREALEIARQRGFAEPDAQRDVDGRDAADKLALIITALGWGAIDPGQVETASIESLSAADTAAAARLGGRIKPIALAQPTPNGVRAFSGPAWVSSEHELSGVQEERNALLLEGVSLGRLLFSGPGAGPEVTAGTLLDDVAAGVLGRSAGRVEREAPGAAESLDTAWFVRLAFDQSPPPFGDVLDVLNSFGVWARRVEPVECGYALLTQPLPRAALDEALRAVSLGAWAAARVFRALHAEDEA